MVDDSNWIPERGLRTRRLVIRRFCADDLENLVALDNDPEVMRWLTGGRATLPDVIESEILPRFCTESQDDPPFGFHAANLLDGNPFAGWLCLRRSPHERSVAMLGFRFRREYWGLGLATEGATELLEVAFSRGLARVVATTYEENAGSRRVMEKLGMHLVRRFRLSPEEIAAGDTSSHKGEIEVWDGDDVEYAITRAAWMAQRSR